MPYQVFENQGYLTLTLDMGVDISSADSKRILWTSPTGGTGYFPATVVESTKLRYQLTNDSIPSAGVWKFQACVIIGGLTGYGEVFRQQFNTTLY